MNVNAIAILFLSAATFAGAQTAKPTTEVSNVPVAPKPAPVLDATEQLAIKDVVLEYNNANKDIKAVSDAITVHHPGYTFNFQTGQLVEISKPTEPVKTEDKK
jgi:hypothetical protein